MSVRVKSMVFDGGPKTLAQHSFMISLADNADDSGVGWPGDELLAQKSRLSVRQVIRVRAELEAEGWLAVVRRSRVVRDGRECYGNLYRMNLAKLEASAVAVRAAREAAREARRRRRDTVSGGFPEAVAKAGTCTERGDTVSPAAATCHGSEVDMTSECERHDMTLAEVLFSQRDTFDNRKEPSREPSSTPLPPASGGVALEGGEAGEGSGGEAAGEQALGTGAQAAGSVAAWGGTSSEAGELAEELREVNAMRARMRPPLPPLPWEEFARERLREGVCEAVGEPAGRVPGRGGSTAAERAGEIEAQAERVLGALGVAGDRRLAQAIGAALELECVRSGLTAEQAGALAIGNVRAFLGDRPLMRHGWGWKKFFAHGYWNRPEAWPYDPQAVRRMQQRRAAAVGAGR